MVFWQYFIPQHFLSKLIFRFTRIKNRWIYKKFTLWIIKTYNVNLSEAKLSNIDDYSCFNDFFTRELRDGIRPIGDGLVSPVDGTLSQCGIIKNNKLIQAKGKNYTLIALLGNNLIYKNFATIYLAPSDYHRIHAPLAGKLLKMDYIGGDLFSVNSKAINSVNNLFARNERIICYFDSFTIVLIGAIFVGSIQTIWHGMITPPYDKKSGKCFSIDYTDKNISLNKGDELGRFNMGSTIILLSNDYEFNKKIGHKVQMGESLISRRIIF